LKIHCPLNKSGEFHDAAFSIVIGRFVLSRTEGEMLRKFGTAGWNRYAADYDCLNELRPYARMVEKVVRTLRSAEYPILDAGCGTGNLTARLADMRTGRVVGIDSSDAMLKQAKRKCAEMEFHRVDLNSRLPFGDSEFGTIACINTLYALADPAAVLREFSRLLRQQGLLVLATPKLGYENGLILKSHCRSRKPDSYWRDAHASPEREELLVREAIRDRRLAERFLRIARYNRAIAHENSFHFFTASELSRLARESGFLRVRIKETYAGQNLLLVAKRNPTGAPR
jgi:ubiquinone/menaquinone biosynthesis C-methylase UbiE